MKTLARVARKHPQYAHVGLHKSLQKEWSFVQRLTPGIRYAFGPVEEAMQETFGLALFQGLGEGAPGRGVTRLPVKQAVLTLPDTANTAPENWTASCVITGHLVAALRGQVDFWMADHSACLQEGQTAEQKQKVLLSEVALEETIAAPPAQGARCLQYATKTGDWLKMQPSTVNGTELDAQECQDSLFLRYGLDLPDLPHYCDGCNTNFSIFHTLDCMQGVLVTARHNKLREGVADLTGKTFNS